MTESLVKKNSPVLCKSISLTAFLLAFTVMLSTLFCSCQSGDKTFKASGFAMDAPVSLTLYNASDAEANRLLGRVSALEQKISATIPSSQVSKINSSTVKVENVTETAGIIRKIMQVSIETGGLFDPACGVLVDLWNINGENPRVPDKKDIESAVKKTDFRFISFDNNSVALRNGVKLDLGAVGKGAACDDILEQLKITGHPAVLSVGGSILTYGQKPGNENWTVAVKDPQKTSQSFCELSLCGTNNISTSGAYERYFEQDGKIYHHILNPKTGYPAQSDILSVTVVCDSGTIADALSTACFLVGSEKSENLLELFSAEAVIVKKDKTVIVTDGLKNSIKLTNDAYTLKGGK